MIINSYDSFASVYLTHSSYTDPANGRNVGVDVSFKTIFNEAGISCQKQSNIGGDITASQLWEMSYGSKEDADKVSTFMSGFSEDDKLTFATQEDFWKDYLSGVIAPKDFMDYYAGTNNGIPDFVGNKENGISYRDTVSDGYADYLNNDSFLGHVYSEDELQGSWYKDGKIHFQDGGANSTVSGLRSTGTIDDARNASVFRKNNGGPVAREAKVCPYSSLAKDGIIENNGNIFICDYENNRITLGDMTNKKDCIFIDLPSGGVLGVNKNAMSSLADSMEMFSPEDQQAIMNAMMIYNMVEDKKKELEEDETDVGEETADRIENIEVRTTNEELDVEDNEDETDMVENTPVTGQKGFGYSFFSKDGISLNSMPVSKCRS